MTNKGVYARRSPEGEAAYCPACANAFVKGRPEQVYCDSVCSKRASERRRAEAKKASKK